MTNPLLAEISSLSPAAKTALAQAHAATAQPAPAAPSLIKDPSAQPPVPPLGGANPQSAPAGNSQLIRPPASSIASPIAADQAKLQHMEKTGSGISQIHSKVASLFPNHPKLGGALGWAAQVPTMLADVGASAVAPEITANLPGTEYHHNKLIAEGQRQIGQDVGNQEKQAQTGLQNAQAEEAQARIPGIENPPQDLKPLETSTGIDAFDPRKGTATPVMGANGQPLTPAEKQPKANLRPEQVMGPDGKPMMANYDPATGIYTDQSGKPIPNAQPFEKPSAPQHITVMGPDGKAHVMGADAGGNFTKDLGVAPPSFAETGLWQPMEGTDSKGNLTPGRMNERTGQFVPNNSLAAQPLPKDVTAEIGKELQTARDSDRRLAIMDENTNSALKGDQQAMLSLLSNHLAMTMGMTKGARMNQALIEEAEKSRPWLQGMKTKFDSNGYLTGVTLSPEQMHQMVGLAQTIRDQQWNQVHSTFSQYGIPLNGGGPDSGTGGGSTGIEVKTPGGKSYSFKDQAAADKFKAAAGIK